jgi:transposase-like protein
MGKAEKKRRVYTKEFKAEAVPLAEKRGAANGPGIVITAKAVMDTNVFDRSPKPGDMT